jgi:RNA polymerase sigma factor (sigma-70 family)
MREADRFNAAMPGPASPPADDAFARRLWRPAFIRQVRIASRPVIPAILRPDHDDLIQEALIRAYNARATYKGASDADLLKWVLVILRNHARDVADKRSKEPEFEPLPVDSPGAKGDDPAQIAEAREAVQEEVRLPASVAQWLATARGVLGCLSPDDQEILKLRVGSNFSVGETARMLGIPEGAVKMRYRRAFERVVELAKRAGLGPGGPRALGRPSPPPPAGEGEEEE